jgi:hypothetical protein
MTIPRPIEPLGASGLAVGMRRKEAIDWIGGQTKSKSDLKLPLMYTVP